MHGLRGTAGMPSAAKQPRPRNTGTHNWPAHWPRALQVRPCPLLFPSLGRSRAQPQWLTVAARGIVWHGTAQHSTARHGTAQHGTARHGTARHGTEGNRIGRADRYPAAVVPIGPPSDRDAAGPPRGTGRRRPARVPYGCDRFPQNWVTARGAAEGSSRVTPL